MFEKIEVCVQILFTEIGFGAREVEKANGTKSTSRWFQTS